MASSTKKNRRRHPVPGPVDGNLARKLDSRDLERRLESSGQMDFDRQYHRHEQTAMERRSQQHARAQAAIRAAQKISPMAVVCFLCTAGLMVAMLLCYIRLNAISRSIVEMKEQIDQLRTEQVSLLTRYEQAFDLTSVKEKAEAAGMTQPSESQIYYIDLPGEDQAVAFSDSDVSPVTRFAASVRRKAEELIDEVKEYFQE